MEEERSLPNTAGSSNEPASSTTLEWPQPRPFHEVFKHQKSPDASSPLWMEGLVALVPPSFGSGLDVPRLESTSGPNQEGSRSSLLVQ